MNTAKKPNLIYVFADQLRYFSTSYAGDQNALTPNIDALCKDSINLCQTVSGHPVCAPYRASLFTGNVLRTDRNLWKRTGVARTAQQTLHLCGV